MGEIESGSIDELEIEFEWDDGLIDATLLGIDIGVLAELFAGAEYLSVFAKTGVFVGETNISLFAGSTNVWLTGLGTWGEIKIDADDGDHGILIGQIGEAGANVTLHNGDASIILETLIFDDQTQIKAMNGDIRIKTNGASKIQLKDGNHTIDVGDVRLINVGDGNSAITFEDGTKKGTTIKAGAGSHTIVGTATGETTMTEIELGDSTDLSTVMLFGTFDETKIKAKGAGDFDVYIEAANNGKFELGTDGNEEGYAGGSTLVIDQVGPSGAEIALGHGNHVVALGTAADDDATTIKFEDGNSQVQINGGAGIEAGKGNHVIDAGDVDRILLEDGSQRVAFIHGADNKDAKVEAKGNGDDLIVGTSIGGGTKAEIKTHDGNDSIVLIGGDWASSKVEGGGGFDVLFVDAAIDLDSLDIKDIEEVVQFSPRETVAATLVALGLQSIDVAVGDAFDGITAETFNLLPTPDPRGPEAFDLLVDEAPYTNSDDDSREDRLMEPTTVFFERSDAYEKTFGQSFVADYYDKVEYNKFGDLSGTNAGETIIDTLGSSVIFAMGGDDFVFGGDGHDAVYGGAGNDVLDGGDGSDLLDGGAGTDVLIGGAGIDVFIFRKGDGVTDIHDFELSYDILDVEGFSDLTYETLTEAGEQVGDDVIYDLGDDMLILRDVWLATMVEVDLCIK